MLVLQHRFAYFLSYWGISSYIIILSADLVVVLNMVAKENVEK